MNENLQHVQWDNAIYELRKAYEQLVKTELYKDVKLAYKKEYFDMLESIEEFNVAHYG